MRSSITTRRVLIPLIAFFVASRVVMAWFAANPHLYKGDGISPASDVEVLYQGWASEMIDAGRSAYGQVRIEYPPGSLPFLLTPRVVAPDTSYLVKFIVLMIALDVAGLGGVLLIARRWRSVLGPWLWVLLVPALGPISYLRLDLVPAVATIWAIERASARDWLSSGGWMGFGIVAKLYPVLFIPAGAIASEKRWKFLIGVAVLIALPVVPLLPAMDGVFESVFGYHAERGIQIESLWGSILFLIMRGGGEASIVFNFGALHFEGSAAEALEPLSSLVSAAAVGLGTLLAFWHRERRAETFTEVSFVILALALAFGSVFSPQFLLWWFALGACVACMTDSPLRFAPAALIPIALLTQAIFPYLYNILLAGQSFPVAILWARNIMVLGVAVGSVIVLALRARRREASAPSTEALVSA